MKLETSNLTSGMPERVWRSVAVVGWPPLDASIRPRRALVASSPSLNNQQHEQRRPNEMAKTAKQADPSQRTLLGFFKPKESASSPRDAPPSGPSSSKPKELAASASSTFTKPAAARSSSPLKQRTAPPARAPPKLAKRNSASSPELIDDEDDNDEGGAPSSSAATAMNPVASQPGDSEADAMEVDEEEDDQPVKTVRLPSLALDSEEERRV